MTVQSLTEKSGSLTRGGTLCCWPRSRRRSSGLRCHRRRHNLALEWQQSRRSQSTMAKHGSDGGCSGAWLISGISTRSCTTPIAAVGSIRFWKTVGSQPLGDKQLPTAMSAAARPPVWQLPWHDPRSPETARVSGAHEVLGVAMCRVFSCFLLLTADRAIMSRPRFSRRS